MKFAKTLEEKLLQEWRPQYVNYKMLKKALKLEEAQAVPAFCNLLEAEIKKVQDFMMVQQDSLWQVLCGVDVDISNPLRNALVSVDGCELMVESIQHIQSYVALNHTAVRKIIKKFDKRFHVHFQEVIPMPVMSNLVVNAGDIGTWLLKPAEQCLRLVRTFSAGSVGIERPLRQFNFWVQELRTGAVIARSSVAGEAAYNLRLQLTCGKDLQCRVRNTFIDVSEKNCKNSRERSNSLPPRLHEQSTLPDLPIIDLEHVICDTLEVSPPPREVCEYDSETAYEEYSPAEGSQNWPLERWDYEGETAWKATPKAHTSWSSYPSKEAYRSQASHFSKTPSAGTMASGCVFQGNAESSWERGKGHSKGSAPSSRWWTDSPEACPICGFPIRLLPYPPFKLQATGYDREPAKLVDGPYMVLQVLSTWNFEVLGHQLTVSDIKALDMYMKRCKLGPFRLGRALELLSDKSSQAHDELETLRSRARRRLEGLKHIQRVRMNKLDLHDQAGESPTSVVREAEGSKGGHRGRGGRGANWSRRPMHNDKW